MTTHPQSPPVVTDEVTALLDAFDAFEAAPNAFSPQLTLHDNADGLVFYALRLWASSRRLSVHELTNVTKPDLGEWDVLTVEYDRRRITVISAIRPIVIEPYPGVRVEVAP